MNGLRLIRTICNFSQAALADKLGVSRQAINMWENARRSIPGERKQQLCDFFGIQDASWLDEISEETRNLICQQPMFYSDDGVSEHFFFARKASSRKEPIGMLLQSEPITMNEKCILKREELQDMINDILAYAADVRIPNSHAMISRINTILTAFNGLLDALKTVKGKRPELKVPYFNTVYAVIDALNIAFGNIAPEDLSSRCEEDLFEKDNSYQERYDYRPLALQIAKELNEHLSHIDTLFEPFKKADPPKTTQPNGILTV